VIVGLHTWPVTVFKSLDAVLSRPDLAELSPLKFYVVKAPLNENDSPTIDSGRIYVNPTRRNIDSLTPSDSATTAAAPASPAQESTVTAAYLKVAPAAGDGKKLSAEEMERFRMNQITLSTSATVIKQALAALDDKGWLSFRLRLDAEALLKVALKASFPGNGEIMEIRLQRLVTPDHDEVLLKAIVDAYQKAAGRSAASKDQAPKIEIVQPPAPASESSANVTPSTPAERLLAPGDKVVIRVIGAFPEQPIDSAFTIEPAGTVALGPAYGRVAIAGQTVLQAEATIKKYLEKNMTDIQVQVTLWEPPDTSSPASISGATFLYDGKTFDQWRDLLKYELKPERRTDAIVAMGAFGRSPFGQQAAEALLDVAGDSPLQGAVFEAVTGALGVMQSKHWTGQTLPTDVWLPALMERLKADSEKWNPIVDQILKGLNRVDGNVSRLLQQMATDPAYGPSAAAFNVLARTLPPGSEQLDQMIRDALGGSDPKQALATLQNTRFQRMDAFPQQIDLLIHPDAVVRKAARHILAQSMNHATVPTTAELLLAVLDDPKRADSRAEAIRALGIVLDAARQYGDEASRALTHKILEKLVQIMEEGPQELVAPSLVALGFSSTEKVQGWLDSGRDQVTNELKDRVREAAKSGQLEAAAKEVLGSTSQDKTP
jgi:hypothetical protein